MQRDESQSAISRTIYQTKIVGIFCGTDANFKSDDPLTNDQAFGILSDYVETKDSNTKVYGFSGCHTHGSRIIAKDLDIDAKHLLNIIKESCATLEGGKCLLALTAHSRGCITGFLLVKMINDDANLKNQVDIVLDMRDPVPGELKNAVKLDSIFKKSTFTNLCRDLSHCANVIEANITVLQKGNKVIGNRSFGFNVLIPIFHPNTAVYVEHLPGAHNALQTVTDNTYTNEVLRQIKALKSQEKNLSEKDFMAKLQELEEIHSELVEMGNGDRRTTYKDNEGCYIQWEQLYQLALLKSLSMLAEYGIALKEESILLKYLDGNLDQVKEFVELTDLKSIRNAQLKLYDFINHQLQEDIFKYFNPNKNGDEKDQKILFKRDLHFDGKFAISTDQTEKPFLNSRHAALAGHPNPDPAQLRMAYKGNKRPDIANGFAVKNENTDRNLNIISLEK